MPYFRIGENARCFGSMWWWMWLENKGNAKSNKALNILFLLFKYSCLHLHTSILPHPSHPHLPPSNLPPSALSICPLYMFLNGPSPIIPHYPSLPSSLVTISLFFISMTLVVFCLFVCFIDYVPVKGEIIWYLSLTIWLISLSIMLSSSIHAVTKGRSSFLMFYKIVLYHWRFHKRVTGFNLLTKALLNTH